MLAIWIPMNVIPGLIWPVGPCALTWWAAAIVAVVFLVVLAMMIWS
jgi:hypothetical protein